MSIPAPLMATRVGERFAEALERLDTMLIKAETARHSAHAEHAILDQLITDPAWDALLDLCWMGRCADTSSSATTPLPSGSLGRQGESSSKEPASTPSAQIAQQLTLRDRYRALEHLNASLGRLLLAARTRLVPLDAARDPVARSGGLTRWQERRAKEFLSANLKQVKIADAARECGLSRSHFIKAFKQATGETPHRWLLRLRTSKAQALLLGSLSIAEIAQECGFADQSHFTRVFRSLVGVPPGLWRRHCSDDAGRRTQAIQHRAGAL